MQTLSYSHGTSTTPLRGEIIGQSLRKTVEKYGNREALVMVEQNYRATYQEFWEQVEQVAKSLLAYGIVKGDRVGIWSPNRYEWVLVQFATARVGAILVTINPGYKTNDLQYALNQSQINLLIAAPNFRQTNYMEMLEKIRPLCEYPEQTVIMDHDWQDFLKAGESVSTVELEAREQTLQFDDPINIQYTSGTTGFPKGATLSHHNILNNGFFIGQILKYTAKDRVCIPVPFYHCFGMVIGNLACITHGSCMVIPAASFDPEQVMQTVQDEKCTSLYGVPTMFIAELGHPSFPKYDFSTLRTGVMAGSNCPTDTMKKVQQLMNMQEVTVCYGMTETSPVSTQSRTDAPLDKRVSTVGTVHPHLEIKIVDPEIGQVVPRGERGELCTRGYSVMLGYWNMPEATSRAIRNGWMHTGDLAVMDEEGYVQIVGRIKDLIIRGGENIAPREIEEFLLTHEDIVDVHVIGVPDAKYGEEVMAWVKLKGGITPNPELIKAYCRGQIATIKIPKYWKFVEDFPMTVTGKIRKVEMREISTKELGLESPQ
ncbi:AMP-binding protein [Pontibacter anaerobius]|uniref:AMP-binding protein n=1 Tax=Pontibacter anaerobius TaxID=2993940 RepID=A0ABT3RB67_9BACT|nr:AMP-binding protein [Pontibacter anaerobius]MCX2739112.1 AMP-binding protein [Pontibacter anaerobius]